MAAKRVALVTGANQGIGYATVRRICKEYPDWVVYGTSRNASNGEEATQKLKEEGHTAIFLQADLTDEKSFIAVKEKLVKEHGGLDVLVNNAGMAFKQASTDPFPVQAEVTLATNVFGTNMVCQQLFPILRDGARVVILGSFVALMALNKMKSVDESKYQQFIKSDPPMPLTDIMSAMQDFVDSAKAGTLVEKKWPDNGAYGMSKLANTLMARAMSEEFKKIPERDIVVNAADPGYVSTSMSSHKGHLSIDEGADTPFYLATLPPKTSITGQHVSKREIAPWQ